MTPLHLSFHRLVRRNIPQLLDEELNRYDSLIAFRHQLDQESSFLPPPKSTLKRKDFIDQVSQEANDILRPYKREYEATVRLWNARRQAATRLGNSLQIPDSAMSLLNLIGAFLNYYFVAAVTFPVFAWNWIKFYKGIIFIAVVVTLLGFGLREFIPPDQRPKPDVGNGVVQPDSTVNQPPAQVDSLQ